MHLHYTLQKWSAYFPCNHGLHYVICKVAPWRVKDIEIANGKSFHDEFLSVLNHLILQATFPLQTLVIGMHINQELLDYVELRQQLL